MKKLFLVRMILVLALTAISAVAQTTRATHRVVAESPRTTRAVEALFEKSNLDEARRLTQMPARAVRTHADMDSLFVAMESAALQADTAVELEAALRLCEAHPATADSRVNLAAARVMDLAGNTTQFSAAVPRIQALVASDVPQKRYLQAALIAAAGDGVPSISLLQTARESGLITDWQLAGPFGHFANVAFDQAWAPEHDALLHAAYNGRTTEALRFENGTFSVPDYFDSKGVFYAATDVRFPAGHYRLRVESGGTVEVLIDGAKALTKDDRFRATAEIAWQSLELSPGTHRVLVKFIASGAPFRVALLPASKPAGAAAKPIAFEAEAAYVHAAEEFWAGDYSGAVTELNALLERHPSAITEWLLAQVWSQIAQNTPEELTALQAVIKLAPQSTAAEYGLAARAYSDGKLGEAYSKAKRVTDARPEFVPGVQLLAQAATRLKWNAEASDAIDSHIRLHPTCSALRDAVTFFNSISAYQRAGEIEPRLESCAPGSLDYAETLRDVGHHAQAAEAAQHVFAAHPYDRNALALLVEELAASGRTAQAEQQARALIALAPNANNFRRLAETASHGGQIADAAGSANADFSADEQFYTPYQRRAFDVIKKTKDRHFSGGPILMLLNDRVASVDTEGNVSLYVHKLTRLLGRDGIEQYGEVSLPENAEVLELRTIKADGTVVEPEFNQHKATISMPALAAGDVIEQEYVVRYRDGGIMDHADAFQFTFGSFNAPILYSRFIVLTPSSANVDVSANGDVPAAVTHETQFGVARVWQRDDIAQAVRETAMPQNDTLPNVRVLEKLGGWAVARDRYRDSLITATRIGARVEAAAAALKGSDEERARAAYQLVTTRIRPAGSVMEIDTAEDTLSNLSGSRTATLIAIARATGLDADVVLTRRIDDVDRDRPSFLAYTHPLVLFRLSAGNMLVDAESDGVPFGAVPPTTDRTQALLVPVEIPTSQPLIALNQFVSPSASEHSEAVGDIRFNEQGDLQADVTITMGNWRGAQMRNILAGVQPSERKHFFEQLAGRIFSGVNEADGEVRNEFDSERRLQLVVHCRAPRFLTFRGDYADMEQLVPALGLKKMYVGSSARNMPLYIDVPLDETSVFHVHLPQNARVLVKAQDYTVQNDFGQYAVTFRQTAAGDVDIRREFRVPVQLVAPERFSAFANFARDVDDAERQRITLERVRTNASRN
jgi:tetratricopeptide (TPR) repeat protein